MMRSLYSGVAGLRTHQTKMDVLGNNIANVNTTSFKSQSITFSDLMYQTTQTASGATATKGGVNARQIGLGAKSGAIATAIESQGATQTTNNPFDIMITGKSFFVVNNGKENLYTRDGSFYVDGAGNLAMQSNGYLVQGWVAQEDKETGEIKVNRNGGLSSLQIMSADNSTYSPASTTQALYSGNIDDNDTNVTSDDGKTITLEFYDNKGYLYTGKFTLKDTGTDHLFSLQLTDIIDSDGNSIGAERMAGVTFGQTQSADKNVTDAYDLVVGNTTADINLLAGATVYSGVPSTGTLSDLMTSARTKYSGILNKVYGITDAQVTSGANGYSKTSAYSIADDGTLTISYEKTDASAKTNGYTQSANTLPYYVSNDGSGLAYLVPTTTEPSQFSTSTSAFKTTMKNVFGLNDSEITTYSSSSKYLYQFTSNASGDDTVRVYKSPSLTQKATPSAIGSLSGYYEDFAGLEDAVDSYADQKYYTYDGTNLKVYGATYDSSAGVTPSDYTQIDSYTLSALSEKTEYQYSALTDEQKTELADILNKAGLITTATTETLDTYMSGNSFTYFSIENITGTNGVLFYKQKPGAAPDTASGPIYDGNAFSKTYTANETTYPVSTPPVKFTSTSDGSAYVLTGEEKTLADYSEDMLKNVFKINKSDHAGDRSVSITSGTITIYHVETVTPTMNSDYAATKESDGTIKYVTTNDTLEYDNVPLTGNITDLLATASGAYKGLLSKVYGVSDEDADAYGSDGTYTINADGSMTLTTGTQSIQLIFNPATGALTTANGNANGLVDMVFDQSIPGNEAFGYQMQANDGEEAVAGRLTVDFSTVTNYNTSGASTIKAIKGDKKSLNTGRAVGEMNGVNVSTDGQIFATYSNGQTKLLGQIASAEFANASGLAKEGDNLYSSTLNSGEATVQDITTDGGYMNTGVLEMSNVDLSREFTEMITTQRGFQANSRIITVSDTLLEELTNLKR